MSPTYRLERAQLVPLPLDQVFAFFADAGNLEAITPPFLHFRIVTPQPIALHEGALIDYRLRLFGCPFRWRTRIDEFVAGVRFVDSQLRGPYALWRHLHEFHETPRGVVVIDRIDYRLPLGPLGRLAHGLFVRRTLDRIFDYRRQQIAALLAPEPSALLAPAAVVG